MGFKIYFKFSNPICAYSVFVDKVVIIYICSIFFSPSAQATDFIKRNIVLSSGFVGGFFLGLAS